MSVTFHQSPQAFTPSDNPVYWSFSSNQTGQPNFSYIVEVYVNGVLDGRHEVFPEVGARAHFDASEIMTRLTPVASVEQTTVSKAAGNTASVYVTVLERYGSPPAYAASATSSTVKCFKARLTNEQMEEFLYQQYAVSAVPLFQFMTFNTNALKIHPDKDYFLTFLQNGEDSLALVFNLFQEDGTAIPSSEVAIPDGLAVVQMNLRTSFIVAENGVIDQATFDTAAYMEIYVAQGGGDPISETKRIYFDRDDCSQLAHCVWLNRLGGFDCYNFSHNTISSATVESTSYEKQFGGWEGNLYVLNSQNSGQLDYLKTTRNRMQLVSGYITEAEQQYLVTSMYNSPLCWISGAVFRRVKIESTAYELHNDRFEEEFTEIVELSLPNTDQSARL